MSARKTKNLVMDEIITDYCRSVRVNAHSSAYEKRLSDQDG